MLKKVGILENFKVKNWCQVVVALYSTCAVGGELSELRIDGADAGLEGFTMSLDGAYVGMVGDVIAISPTGHELEVELPSGLKISYLITQNEGRFQAAARNISECVGATSWSVRTASVPPLSQGAAGRSLSLLRVKVSFEGFCPVDVPYQGCFWRQGRIDIRAVPDVGAEVWIDGVRIVGSSPSVLNFGYCGGSGPTAAVLLRKVGYTTCRAAVKIQDEHGPYIVECSMRRVAVDARGSANR